MCHEIQPIFHYAIPASFMQMERVWCNIATYVINLCTDGVLFHLLNLSVDTMIYLKSAKAKIRAQINSISENKTRSTHRLIKQVAALCQNLSICIKLAGSIMKY